MTNIKVASAQVRTIPDPWRALNVLEAKVRQLSADDVDIVLFPEVFIGGFPRLSTFDNSSVGKHRTQEEYGSFLRHAQAASDLGDTSIGEGSRWLNRLLPVHPNGHYRGDGTRERLEEIAKGTGVFVVVGVLEKAGGTLYSSLLYVCPREGIIGKRRKVMPTGLERVVWAQGSPSTLQAVTTIIRGTTLRLSGALCWENWMPLLRQSIYAQNVDIFFAPTAHATEIWAALIQTMGIEGNVYVMTATPYVRANELRSWISEAACLGDKIVSRGGSMITSPRGEIISGPCWDQDDEILLAEIDISDRVRALQEQVFAGRSMKHDAFRLNTSGLALP